MRPALVYVAVDSTHTKGPRSWRYLAGAGLTASTKLRRQYTQTLAAGAVRLLSDDRSRRSACHRRTCVEADCDAMPECKGLSSDNWHIQVNILSLCFVCIKSNHNLWEFDEKNKNTSYFFCALSAEKITLESNNFYLI